MRLALSGAASSPDGSYIDDLVTLGNIIAVGSVGALIKIRLISNDKRSSLIKEFE